LPETLLLLWIRFSSVSTPGRMAHRRTQQFTTILPRYVFVQWQSIPEKETRFPEENGFLQFLLAADLNVIIQRELVRMRPQPDGVHFFLALVPDPGADDVAGEHVALEQELVVFFQAIERF